MKSNEEFYDSYNQSVPSGSKELSVEEQVAAETKNGIYSISYKAKTDAQKSLLQQFQNAPLNGPIPFNLTSAVITWDKLVGGETFVNRSAELSWEIFDVCYANYKKNPEVWKDVTCNMLTAGMLNKIARMLIDADFEMFGQRVEMADWVNHCAYMSMQILSDYDETKGKISNFWAVNEKIIERKYKEFYIGQNAQYAFRRKIYGGETYGVEYSVDELQERMESKENAWDNITRLSSSLTDSSNNLSSDAVYMRVKDSGLDDILCMFIKISQSTNITATLKKFEQMLLPICLESDRGREVVETILKIKTRELDNARESERIRMSLSDDEIAVVRSASSIDLDNVGDYLFSRLLNHEENNSMDEEEERA